MHYNTNLESIYVMPVIPLEDTHLLRTNYKIWREKFAYFFFLIGKSRDTEIITSRLYMFSIM